MNTHPLSPSTLTSQRRQKHLFLFATLLLISGTSFWILNIVGVIPGPWSNIFSALATSIGIFSALLNSLLVLFTPQRRDV